MGELADLVAADGPAVNARRSRGAHPKGWEPGYEWDGNRGTVAAVSETGQPSREFQHLLEELGFDPDTHEIVGNIQVRRWQQRPGDDYLYYHRATVALRSSQSPDADVDALLVQVGKRRPRRSVTTAPGGAETTHAGLVIGLADWQVGKADGDGVEGVMNRLDDLVGQVQDRVRDLKKLGVRLETIYPCFMGDLFEACSGHYAQQEFRTQLDIRDQRKIIRWAADRLIDKCGTVVPSVGVKVVGGNHGEERQNGKSYTTFADNRDVAVIEDIAYAYSLNPDRYGHISFAIPSDDLTHTFDHEGVIIGLAHSHQAGFGSGDPRAKIDRWWRGQMAGQQPIGDADILVTAHWHHPWMLRSGARTHFGCPALDGGSDWFRNYSGMDAPPGTLTFVVDGSGWSHMEILQGVRDA